MLTLFLFLTLSSALIITVPPKSEECLIYSFQENVDVNLVFQVTSGGALDIDVLVNGPDQRVLVEAYKESEGKHSFTSASAGEFRICFSNKFSHVSDKVINFLIEDSNSKLAKIDDVGPLEKGVLQLSEAIHNIKTENKYMRLRERAHRDTTESTNARVLWLTFAETLMLISVSLYQLYYLKSFFEVRKTV
eukprot:TRINITY_DN86_c0_g2_i1.p1 TRINITY_DN86_c0_g2~~TRINITY_DN86_c0_g2_i1.p1  ORF type:complete len:191 (-),score=24.39 TRINITY_DN86_c0_g2_i1:31-603(-)